MGDSELTNLLGYKFVGPMIDARDVGDHHGLVVRGHMMIERTLYGLIESLFGESKWLEKANLSFEQVVLLSIASGRLPSELSTFFLSFNRLRDRFAHNRNARLDKNTVTNLHTVLRKFGGSTIIDSMQRDLHKNKLSDYHRFNEAPLAEQMSTMIFFMQKTLEGCLSDTIE